MREFENLKIRLPDRKTIRQSDTKYGKKRVFI